MKLSATNKLTIMRTLAIVSIGLVTLTSCNQNNHNSEMMHNNGGSYYWGMHMGWWFFALLIVIILIFIKFKKRK
jgi:cell division protein FtsW (lipid II flippase)